MPRTPENPDDDQPRKVGRWRSVGTALTGGRGARAPKDIAGALRSVYGEGRGGRPDTAAAAAALGVSRRTVQRWLQQPPKRASEHVAELHRQAEAAARRKSVSGRRAKQLRSGGAKVLISGRIRFSDDTRPRTINYRFSGEAIAPVMEAYAAGGEDAAREALQDMLHEHYSGGGVERLDRIEFRL